MRMLSLMFGIILAGMSLASACAQEIGQSELSFEKIIARSAGHLAFGFDSLWTISEGKLLRVYAVDSSIVEIDLPGSDNGGLLTELDRYRGIAVGENAIWVPDMASSTIFKIDPDQNKLIMKIPTDIFGSAGSIGVGEGSVWVVTFDTRDKTLTRYDARNGAVQQRIPLPNSGRGVLVALGSVWVTAASHSELYMIDPSAALITATIRLHDSSNILVAAGDSIWVPFDREGLVQRVDGQTGEVVATIDTGTSDMEADGDITSGGGFVWTINRGSTVARIDIDTNLVKGNYRPPVGTIAGRRLRYGDGSLWLSGRSIFRATPPN